MEHVTSREEGRIRTGGGGRRNSLSKGVGMGRAGLGWETGACGPWPGLWVRGDSQSEGGPAHLWGVPWAWMTFCRRWGPGAHDMMYLLCQ